MADAVLAGGYRKGDRVASLIAHEKVSKGDVGTVVGPCSSDATNKADRVHVDFGPGGKWDFIASTQLKHEVLAGGYRKGDRVASLIAHEKVSKGDIGTIVGACNNESLTNPADRVNVDFGPGGRFNFFANQLKHEVLAGGYRKDDRVASLIDHEKVSKGDIGTIVGPCNNESLTNPADRVLVDFGPGGRFNFVAESMLQRATAAAGNAPKEKAAAEKAAKQKAAAAKAAKAAKEKAAAEKAAAEKAAAEQAAAEIALKEAEEAQLAAAIAASLEVSDPVAPTPAPVTRAKRWGDGLEAPAAGSRNFVPQGFEVTLDVSEAISRFGHNASHVAQIINAGRAKASTSSTPLASTHAAALYAYTEDSPLYGTLNYTMRTPHTPTTPTDTELKRYGDYIVHTERALSSLPTHVSEILGNVYTVGSRFF